MAIKFVIFSGKINRKDSSFPQHIQMKTNSEGHKYVGKNFPSI